MFHADLSELHASSWDACSKIEVFRGYEEDWIGSLGGGLDWEFGMSRCKQLYLECINNKILLYTPRKLYSIFCNKP